MDGRSSPWICLRHSIAQHMLVSRWSPDTSPYFLIFWSKRVDRFGFYCAWGVSKSRSPDIAHTRGNHTHLLASYFLVRSSIALRLHQVNTGVSYFLDLMLKISTVMVVLSVPVSILIPYPMYSPLPLLVVLYLTPPAVTNVTRNVKYKHASNR